MHLLSRRGSDLISSRARVHIEQTHMHIELSGCPHVHIEQTHVHVEQIGYGVATIGRLLKIVGLFCRTSV